MQTFGQSPAGDRIYLSNEPNVVDGKYLLLNKLASGGMGSVYHAKQIMLDREVALKTFNSDDLSMEDIQRFQREAQTIARLNHKNIVPIFDCGVTELGLPYYAMEYISGQTLGQRLCIAGALTIDDALSLGIQLSQALAVAHHKDIIHRDIKPDNIFLDRSTGLNNGFTIKLVDFGLVSLGDQTAERQKLTKTGVVYGSPPYMSPEQSQGKLITSKSDIYSLGCTLFEALTGTPPFMSESILEIIIQHQDAAPPTLREASKGKIFPEALEDAIAQMLAKKPEHRQKNMEIVTEQLSEIVEDLRIPARPEVFEPATPSEMLPDYKRSFKRRKQTSYNAPVMAGSVVALLVACLLLTGNQKSAKIVETKTKTVAAGIEPVATAIPKIDAAVQENKAIARVSPPVLSRQASKKDRHDFYHYLETAFKRQNHRDDIVYLNQAMQDLYANNPQSALTYADLALEKSPQDGIAYAIKGFAEHELDKEKETIADLTRAAALEPLTARYSLYDVRGRAYSDLQYYDACLADTKRAMALDPRPSYRYNLIGDIYQDKQDFAQALTAYSAGIRQQPLDEGLLRSRGHCLARMHRYKDALADFSEAIKIASNPNAYASRARIYDQLGKKELAAKDRAASDDKGYQDLEGPTK